jgi:DNA-binding XRE family transcriptional regulator
MTGLPRRSMTAYRRPQQPRLIEPIYSSESSLTPSRSARDRLGITQQRLSEIAELPVTGVAMIERGERVPNLDTAARICWALDVAAGAIAGELDWR